MPSSEITRDALADTGSAEAGAHDAGGEDPLSVASALNGLFMEAPCDPATPTPLAQGATCQHPPKRSTSR